MTRVTRCVLAALTVSIASVAGATAQTATPQPAAPPPVAPVISVPPPRFVVVLDAAHGGDDLGGHLSDGTYEKAATLALSVRLKSLLGARGIQVIMTRDADQSVGADQRAAIANHANAQACISLHVAETGSGVHLFASNLSPVTAGRFMPWKTAQSVYVTRSLALTGALNSALQHGGAAVTLARVPLPGVDNMMCPAVAIELAPERNADKKVIAEPDNPDYQARIAGILATALLEWRAEAGNTGGRQP
jgi:N-acetylmuramoyl-L-alanine amidase